MLVRQIALPKYKVQTAAAVCFFMAAIVVLAPLMLNAQAPASRASNAYSTVSQAPVAGETNESAELAQKLTNPLASLISVPTKTGLISTSAPRRMDSVTRWSNSRSIPCRFQKTGTC